MIGMQTFLIILLALAAIGAVVALIRGIVIFLRTSSADLKGGPDGLNMSGVRQNKMMRMRILFQALAVIFAVLLLLLKRAS